MQYTSNSFDVWTLECEFLFDAMFKDDIYSVDDHSKV